MKCVQQLVAVWCRIRFQHFEYRSFTVAASMRRPPCVKRYADFFLFVHRYCPLPTNGRHSTPQPPVRGFFPAAIAIVPRRPTGGATSLPPTPLVFILRKVFLPLTTTPRCRPAGGASLPSVPLLSTIAQFRPASIRTLFVGNSACQLGSFFKLIGCCHLRIELNAPSCDRPFVPPRPRSHPDSAIGVSRHPS